MKEWIKLDKKNTRNSIAIRVVDVFGNDATAVVDVDLRGV